MGIGFEKLDEAAQMHRLAATDLPVQLTTDTGPLGHGMLYPSPAMYDIDGDGKAEMIVADLFGNVQMARKAPGADTHWGALTPLASRKATPLKFSNW